MNVSVVIGSSRFTDCLNVIGYKDQPLLRTMADPLRVTLQMPAQRGLPPTVTIQENAIISSSVDPSSQGLSVSPSSNSVAVVWKGVPLVMATQISPETIVGRIDLRPLGVAIFDDAYGLHIGANVLSNNAFERCTTAIGLQ